MQSQAQPPLRPLRFGVVSESVPVGTAWLDILTRLFDGQVVRHSGESYRIDGLDLGAVPGLAGRPPLVVGAGGPRMLRLAARYADVVGLLPAPIRNARDSDDPGDRMPAA